jgi:hypothetical protein
MPVAMSCPGFVGFRDLPGFAALAKSFVRIPTVKGRFGTVEVPFGTVEGQFGSIERPFGTVAVRLKSRNG